MKKIHNILFGKRINSLGKSKLNKEDLNRKYGGEGYLTQDAQTKEVQKQYSKSILGTYTGRSYKK